MRNFFSSIAKQIQSYIFTRVKFARQSFWSVAKNIVPLRHYYTSQT